MFILSECIRLPEMGRLVQGPKFAVDFPDFGFAVCPENQRCALGEMIRLQVGPPSEQEPYELTPEQRQAILALYREVS